MQTFLWHPLTPKCTWLSQNKSKKTLRKYWENFFRNYAPFYIQGGGIITEMTVPGHGALLHDDVPGHGTLVHDVPGHGARPSPRWAPCPLQASLGPPGRKVQPIWCPWWRYQLNLVNIIHYKILYPLSIKWALETKWASLKVVQDLDQSLLLLNGTFTI